MNQQQNQDLMRVAAELGVQDDDRPTGGPGEVHATAPIPDTDPTPDELARQRYDEGSSDVEPKPLVDGLEPWMRGKFRFSDTTFRGGRWNGVRADGKPHLVPEKDYVTSIINIHDVINAQIERQTGSPWYRIMDATVRNPNDAVHDAFTETAEGLLNMQRLWSSDSQVWFQFSSFLRDAMQDTLARRATLAYDLIDLIERHRRSDRITDNMAQHRATVEELYATAKERAAIFVALWMQEREVAKSQLGKVKGDTATQDAQSFVTTPEHVDISYAVTGACMRQAWYIERGMETDKSDSMREAARAETLDSIAF